MQGVSKITERKEFEIYGLALMRMNMWKNKWNRTRKIIIADIFSGDGTNVLNTGERIEGSPLKLGNACKHALSHGKFDARERLRKKEISFWFSDIRKEAVERCESAFKDIEVPFAQSSFTQMAAVNAVNLLGETLNNQQDAYLLLVVDPNGPKDFPRNELVDLISWHSKRIDLIPNLSATAVNRCLNARDKTDLQFNWWLSEIDGLDGGFVNKIANMRSGWIRKPIAGDAQHWFMLPTFGAMPPRHDWNKQGYVAIGSSEGAQAISYYSRRGR